MDPKPILINGYKTHFSESKDAIGPHLLIYIPSNADKDISNICGTIVDGHLITQIDYCFIDKNRFIKAYY